MLNRYHKINHRWFRYLRRPKTQGERRANTGIRKDVMDLVLEYGEAARGVAPRGKRMRIPSAWDDIASGPARDSYFCRLQLNYYRPAQQTVY